MKELHEIIDLTIEVFGNAERGMEWLSRQHPKCNKMSPLVFATTDGGANKVKSILTAIRYGGAV